MNDLKTGHVPCSMLVFWRVSTRDQRLQHSCTMLHRENTMMYDGYMSTIEMCLGKNMNTIWLKRHTRDSLTENNVPYGLNWWLNPTKTWNSSSAWIEFKHQGCSGMHGGIQMEKKQMAQWFMLSDICLVNSYPIYSRMTQLSDSLKLWHFWTQWCPFKSSPNNDYDYYKLLYKFLDASQTRFQLWKKNYENQPMNLPG